MFIETICIFKKKTSLAECSLYNDYISIPLFIIMLSDTICKSPGESQEPRGAHRGSEELDPLRGIASTLRLGLLHFMKHKYR